MNIRKIIREQIAHVLNEAESDDSVLGAAVGDICAMLQNDIDNIGNIINTQKTGIQNDKAVYKQDNQKKNAISPKIGDIDNPEKKALEREMPLRNQLNHAKEKQLQDLEAAQKDLMAAKSDLEKKRLEIEKQEKMAAKESGKSTTTSPLPSLQSPI